MHQELAYPRVQVEFAPGMGGMGGRSLTCIAASKSLQSCPTLCNPIDGSQPGSPVPGILQARTLEWVAISFSINHLLKVYKLQACVTLINTCSNAVRCALCHSTTKAAQHGKAAPSQCPGWDRDLPFALSLLFAAVLPMHYIQASSSVGRNF